MRTQVAALVVSRQPQANVAGSSRRRSGVGPRSGRFTAMLERNYLFLHFLAALSVVGACTADRSAAVYRLDTDASIGVGGSGPDDGGSDAPVCAYGQIICEGTLAKICN